MEILIFYEIKMSKVEVFKVEEKRLKDNRQRNERRQNCQCQSKIGEYPSIGSYLF